MLMQLRMLKLSVGKGRQARKQLYRRVLQYYATVATERAGYVLYRALVISCFSTLHVIFHAMLKNMGWSGDEVKITVEPPNKGHFGNRPFVLCSEVVLISEVCHILTVA